MQNGRQFSFICDSGHVNNMLKVIARNNGDVIAKRTTLEGVHFTVRKN